MSFMSSWVLWVVEWRLLGTIEMRTWMKEPIQEPRTLVFAKQQNSDIMVILDFVATVSMTLLTSRILFLKHLQQMGLILLSALLYVDFYSLQFPFCIICTKIGWFLGRCRLRAWKCWICLHELPVVYPWKLRTRKAVIALIVERRSRWCE